MTVEGWGAESGGGASTTTLLAESRFIPRRYEPNYAYPLLVLLHGRGADEHQLVKALPRLSWRNYVGLGLRGPEVIEKQHQVTGYAWGREFANPSRNPRRFERPDLSIDTPGLFRRVMAGEPVDIADQIEYGVFESVRRLRRSLHVHTERIYLVGVDEGAAVAVRMGLSYPERFAGVVAINGWLPQGSLRAPVDLNRAKALRLLFVHGHWSTRAPVEQVSRDVSILRCAGIDAAFQTYPTANRLIAPMLADVDRWLMSPCGVVR